jgi:hypothetical protein
MESTETHCMSHFNLLVSEDILKFKFEIGIVSLMSCFRVPAFPDPFWVDVSLSFAASDSQLIPSVLGASGFSREPAV